MQQKRQTVRICPKGHRYSKSSSCPVCPICERNKEIGPFDMLAAPARRALANAGIQSLAALSAWREQDIRQLHGMGPKAVLLLRDALKKNGSTFKREDN